MSPVVSGFPGEEPRPVPPPARKLANGSNGTARLRERFLFALLVALPQGELRCEYRLEVLDAAAGVVEMEARFHAAEALGTATLVDRFADYYSAEHGLPKLSAAARPQIETEELSSAAGPLPAGEPGRRALELGSSRELVVRRRLRIPDRTSGQREHHPSASSLSECSAVFAAMDLFPELEHPRAGAVELHVVLPEGWSLATPWGPGPRLSIPSAGELLEDYFFAAPELEQRSQEIGGTGFTVVSARGALDPGAWHVPLLAALEHAVDAFGALPGERRVILLQRLSGTDFHRTLVDRGVNAPRSVVAYVDDRGDGAYAQSPLAVAVHEAVHWWIPRAMNFQKGSHMPWFSEGLASYYESLLLLRAGILDFPFFAQGLVDQWLLDRDRAGARVPLEEASSRFAQDPLATDVTYRRGALTAFALDVELHRTTSCLITLDAVVRGLLERGGRSAEGLRSADVPRVLESLGGPGLLRVFQEWMTAETTPDLVPVLEFLGVAVEEGEEAYLGVRIGPGSPPPLELVVSGGPAAGALREADEVLALAGHPVATRADLEAALAGLAPGQEVDLRVRRAGAELPVCVVLGGRPAPRAHVLGDVGPRQARLRATLQEPLRAFR